MELRASAVPPPLPPKTRRGEHVVKIRINPTESDGSIRISVGGEEMARRGPYFFYSPYQSSGQSSPSDTLDSGTCSDLDGSTPPPLPKKSGTAAASTVTVTVNGSNHHRTGSLTSSGAEVDSDDDVRSNISCDSLNDIDTVHEEDEEEPQPEPEICKSVLTTQLKSVFSSNEQILKVASPPPPPPPKSAPAAPKSNGLLPDSLLQDIRDRTAKLTVVPTNSATLKKTKTWKDESKSTTPEPKEGPQKQQSFLFRYQSPPPEPAIKRGGIVDERTYEERVQERNVTSPEPASSVPARRSSAYKYEDDRFYKFHLREHDVEAAPHATPHVAAPEDEEETFAGVRDLLGNKDASCTIRSAKGTVRGVKNRVRAGIATFLQFPDTKNYKEKEAGKVVVYTTTMGIVRETYHECLKVKKILRTLLVKYEERDVFMSREVQAEIRERMHCDVILVPQVFVEGQHIGDAETIERLNETGELRRIMKPFKSPDVCNTCQVCGGFRLLPCSVCNGSKKSVLRSDFSMGSVALKCMHCDEVGLVRCYAC